MRLNQTTPRHRTEKAQLAPSKDLARRLARASTSLRATTSATRKLSEAELIDLNKNRYLVKLANHLDSVHNRVQAALRTARHFAKC